MIKSLIKKLLLVTKIEKTKFYAKILYSIYIWQFRNNFVTFSQVGEDIIVRQFIPEDVGFYVDIGSGDPILDNNTYQLYRKGWKGILIDPILENHLKNAMFRPRDKSILGVCGNEIGSKIFIQTTPYQFSYVSGADSIPNKGNDQYRINKSYKINQINLKSLEISIRPDDPFLVSIDVEGYEIEVLNGIDWEYFKPRVILIEQHLKLGIENNFMTSIMNTKVGIRLSENKYCCVGYNGWTAVWVHKIYLNNKFV